MIVVLRLNHRRERDKRASTHVCLTSRAFGASKIVYSGDKDESLESSVKKVVESWGGDFSISYEKDYSKTIKRFKNDKFTIVHLTMYGLPLQDEINSIKSFKDVLVVVGGEKVPSSVYRLADYNISVTSQPHSEIAALTLFLDKYYNSKELTLEFKDAKLKIKPNPKGKSFYSKE
jgi:tRNA (cytidine56-2'-O)-methyltransferase